MPVLPPTYFAPRYFAVRYFGTGEAGPPLTRPVIEAACFDDLVDRIRATQAFRVVNWGASPEVLAPATDDQPSCVIEEVDWDDGDDYHDGEIVMVTYRATITAEATDPVERAAELRNLAAIVANAGTDVSLAGQTFPAMTRLARGRVGRQRHPEGTIVLDGTFQYLLEDRQGRAEG